MECSERLSNKHMKWQITLAWLSVVQSLSAQFWNDTGNGTVTPGTNFLGTTNAAPLDARTSNVHWSRLYPIQTSNFNLTYPAVAQNGFFALSGTPNFFTNAASPANADVRSAGSDQ